MYLEIKDVIDHRYTIVKRFGKSGFGKIFLVKDYLRLKIFCR